MYEVGIALACRNSSDVPAAGVMTKTNFFLTSLQFLTCISILPTVIGQQELLQAELKARLEEQNHLADARIALAVSSLTTHEFTFLAEMAALPKGHAKGWNITGTVLSVYEAAIARLLDKRVIKVVGRFTDGKSAYAPTASLAE